MKESHFIVFLTILYPRAESLKKTLKLKIPFKVTRRYENFNLTSFFIGKFQIVGGFICYVLTHGHFIKIKAEKRKIVFWVTKRAQKIIYDMFSDP